MVQNHLDFIVFIAALLAERYLPISYWYHPNTFLKVVFTALAKRIHRPKEAKSYQYLASSLAVILVLLVLLTLVVLLLEFAYYPELLSGLILYFCLESTSIKKKSTRITRLLKQKQKATARELLKPLLVRETDKLSEVGICKGLIETLILRSARNYFAVIFIYLIAGPIAALGYHLLTQLHYAWRTDIKPDSAFIQPIKVILFIIEFIPIRLLALTHLASKATKQGIHYIKHYGRHFYQTNSGWLLSVYSASLAVQLGGPAVYQGTKYHKMRVGTDRLPTADDIPKVLTLIQQAKSFWLLTIVSIELTFILVDYL